MPDPSGGGGLTNENNQVNGVGSGGTEKYAAPYIFTHIADAADNLTTLRGMNSAPNLSFHADNQLLGNVYDGDGNPPSYGSHSGLTYDPEDRLSSYPGFSSSGYIAHGMRAWKQTNGRRTRV